MTERKLAAPLRATLVEDIDAAAAIPGAFDYSTDAAGNIDGLWYVCPCGCGQIGHLDFKPAPSPSWSWDGRREAPTLEPSIHHQFTRPPNVKETHWHGYLTRGWWRQPEQTVPAKHVIPG